MEEKKPEIIKLDFCLKTEERRYEGLDKHFIETKNRRILLVTAEFAIFAYLFSDLQSLVPYELYGRIFFAIGVIAAIFSLALSFYHCRPVIWPDPIGPVEDALISSTQSELEWKKVALNDYRSANTECKRILSTHSKTMKWSLFFFVVSVTILLIIKFF